MYGKMRALLPFTASVVILRSDSTSHLAVEHATSEFRCTHVTVIRHVRWCNLGSSRELLRE